MAIAFNPVRSPCSALHFAFWLCWCLLQGWYPLTHMFLRPISWQGSELDTAAVAHVHVNPKLLELRRWRSTWEGARQSAS